MASRILTSFILAGVLTGLVIGTAWAQEKKAGEEEGVVRLPEVVVSGTRLLDV